MIDISRFFDFLYEDKIKGFERNVLGFAPFSSAYIFYGDDGIGKSEFAFFVAVSSFCGSIPNCGFCSFCEKIQKRKEDIDIIIIEKDEKSERIKAEKIRELKNIVYIPPYKDKRFVIIKSAHYLTNQGFSALLKIMEDNPPHTIFILTTSQIELIPKTIISRCVRVNFSLPREKFIFIADIIMKEKGKIELGEKLKKIIYNNIKLFIESLSNEELIEEVEKILKGEIEEKERLERDRMRKILYLLQSYIINLIKEEKEDEKVWELVRKFEKCSRAIRDVELFIDPRLILASL